MERSTLTREMSPAIASIPILDHLRMNPGGPHKGICEVYVNPDIIKGAKSCRENRGRVKFYPDQSGNIEVPSGWRKYGVTIIADDSGYAPPYEYIEGIVIITGCSSYVSSVYYETVPDNEYVSSSGD